MSIVVLNYTYMKKTTVTQLLCQCCVRYKACFRLIVLLILQSFKFWSGFWLEIITNTITDGKFSCPLGRTTKLPFSPQPKSNWSLMRQAIGHGFFLALPANTTHISRSLTNSLSRIGKKINIFFWWFLFVSHTMD